MEPYYLEIYLQKIGYSTQHTSSLEVLRVLHEGHTQTFSFENLNPFLKLSVKLDLVSIQHKFLIEGRGGYCYEQNFLFKSVLEAFGFQVRGLAARVLSNNAGSHISPRTHMLLLVKADEASYLADVGFGGLTPPDPLLLKPDIIQETSHERYRLIGKADGYILQVYIQKHWKSLYFFDLQEQFLADYEVANWYTSSHPNSSFVKNLMVSRIAPGCRYTLNNNKFAIHHLNNDTEKYKLSGSGQLREVLEDVFKIKLPDVDYLDSRLEEFIAREKSYPKWVHKV